MRNAERQDTHDVFIIGGGINGCGIARDAAGRGLDVALAEMNDLASATSSASTKLFHGGLRYLEYFELRLVRKALKEREVLLRAMPHIARPMRFVLPYHKDMQFESGTPASDLLGLVMPWKKGRRPAWLIRFGLFLYDHLGGREILPGTVRLNLTHGPEGAPLHDTFQHAYEYSDCWVDDARLVALNARDAAANGAEILTRTRVTRARRKAGLWDIDLTDTDTGETETRRAKVLINVGGPWVSEIVRDVTGLDSREGVRLVRGSHIVTRKLYDHDKAYFFQGKDGRIIFAIPYEQDFTLIGTTDRDHGDADQAPVCTEAERDYLLDFANQYFKRQLTAEDVVWSYSGVRPLYDDRAKSATAATREYVLSLDEADGAPLLNVFGGKITTYRRLAEHALEKIAPFLPGIKGAWTAGIPLPGGDFPVNGGAALVADLRKAHPFLTDRWAWRMVRAYGTDAKNLLGGAQTVADLGRDFGATLTEREVRWLMDREFARRADDVVWRRSKLGLFLTSDDIAALDAWMTRPRNGNKAPAANA